MSYSYSLEQAVLSHPSIIDVHVVHRETVGNDPILIVYAVLTANCSIEALCCYLNDVGYHRQLPQMLCPISRFPLLDNGLLDQQALYALPLVDQTTKTQLAEHLSKQDKITQVAVLDPKRCDPSGHTLPRSHLADINTEWVLPVDGAEPNTPSWCGAPIMAKPQLAEVTGVALDIDPQRPQTLTQALIDTAAQHPDKGIHLIDSLHQHQHLTYAQLLAKAKVQLAGLQQAGLKAGDQVILQLPELQLHFTCFWACVLGGIIPVTVAVPPTYEHEHPVVDKLLNVVDLLERPSILVDGKTAAMMGQDHTLDAYALDVTQLDCQSGAVIFEPSPSSPLFYQLTSGSTGTPKCIIETHGGVVAHIHGSCQNNHYHSDDISLNWLGFDHVVPILTFHLKDVYLGASQIHLSTQVVLADPLAWFDTINEYRVTHSWSPNFGYKLVAERLKVVNGLDWDLGCVKYLMNAGESVTMAVIKAFLSATQVYGLSATAMQPAFGMAESCTCITYNNHFDQQTSELLIAKSSLEGQLCLGDLNGGSGFVELGGPMPGVSIRIVDEHNRVLNQGYIGRFQIKGAVITQGYYRNDQANQAALMDEGWFDSGDLGFICNDSLYLTGRHKEVIIVRGANFYCYEIEDLVNQVEGVKATFCAACAYNDQTTGSEGLAIFFVPKVPRPVGHNDRPDALVKRIRDQISTKLGITPNVVLPLSQQEFHKTTSGKIQRSKFKQQLNDEGLEQAIKQTDIYLANQHTLPDWTYKQSWRPYRRWLGIELNGPLLLFTGSHNIWQSVKNQFERQAEQRICIVISQGPEFVRYSASSYHLDLAQPKQIAQLFSALANDNLIPQAIVCTQGYLACEYATQYQSQLNILQQLKLAYAESVQLIKMIYLSADAFAVDDHYSSATNSSTSRVEPTMTMLSALATSVNEEMPWLDYRHLDMPSEDVSATLILEELQDLVGTSRIAYSNGERYEPALTPARFQSTPPSIAKINSPVLITGGLGGIGVGLCQQLLQDPDCQLLIIGRAPLAGRKAKLVMLEQLAGSVSYVSGDITQQNEVHSIIKAAEDSWGQTLQTIIHMAGVHQTCFIEDETPASIAATLAPKVAGTEVMCHLLATRPDCEFIGFSSISAWFGGLMVSSYAAANLYLEAKVNNLRHQGRRAWCLGWSIWDDLGMNAGNLAKERLVKLGYLAIDQSSGLKTFFTALQAGLSHCLIGLDSEGQKVANHIDGLPLVAQSLLGCIEYNDTTDVPLLEPFNDAFGVKVDYHTQIVEHIPLKADGNVDLQLLTNLLDHRPTPMDEKPQSEVEQQVADLVAQALDLKAVGVHENFFELGANSLMLAGIAQRLQSIFGQELSGIEMFRYPTIRLLAEFFSGVGADQANRANGRKVLHQRSKEHQPIAIIGMSCRFPDADDPQQLWQNLIHGVDSIRELDDQTLQQAGVSQALIDDHNYVKKAAILDDVDLFAAEFFNCSAREARMMDPQQRIFLECSWKALEVAGYDPAQYDGSIGVYAGTTINAYGLMAAPNAQMDMKFIADLVDTDREFIATRTAYKLNLQGPAVNVQTACSTSLVAVHLACQALLGGDADMALAGAASIRVPHQAGHLYQEGGIFSPEGRCRTFDAGANGAIFGNGVGVVLLKPLDQALADGDIIQALIKGSAINNDGNLKAGFTAPSLAGQVEVIREAMRRAEVLPGQISYVETHGTGTSMGDPIEVAALTEAFGADPRQGDCYLGSIKTNIGHLDAASGMAGLIKTCLQLQAKQLVPTVHFNSPNPKIDFANNPFRVADKHQDWPEHDGILHAGISSFGVGGTNAHVILAQPPKLILPPAPQQQVVWQNILMLTAQTEQELTMVANRLADRLEQQQQLRVKDVAYTLAIGKRRFATGYHWLCGDDQQDKQQLIKQLRRGFSPQPVSCEQVPRVIFMFPGQGAQYSGMVDGLYQQLPAFALHLDSLLDHLALVGAQDYRKILFGSANGELLQQTEFTQPLLFVVELALAQTWLEWGVTPDGMIGHSIGEYVAACLAGVMNFEDALQLVITRGRLMQSMAPGCMLSVMLPEHELLPLLKDPQLGDCDLAAVNGPQQTVAAGTEAQIGALEKRLAEIGAVNRRLKTSHAYHSHMLDQAMAPFYQQLKHIRLQAPTMPFISNLSGDWISANEATDPQYWVRHMRHTVRFNAGVETLKSQGDSLYIEVGPGNSLTTLAKSHFDHKQSGICCLPHPKSDKCAVAHFAQTLAGVDFSGVKVDWAAVYAPVQAVKVLLPEYPLPRQAYWLEQVSQPQPKLDMDKLADPNQWFYRPSWQLSHNEQEALLIEDILLFDLDDLTFTQALARHQIKAITVGESDEFIDKGKLGFLLNPTEPSHYLNMLASLKETDQHPECIVHCWNAASQNNGFDNRLNFGFFSILHLVHGLIKLNCQGVKLAVVSCHSEQVIGDETVQAERAMVQGLCSVLTQEYPQIDCFHTDIDSLENIDNVTELLLQDLASTPKQKLLAYRVNSRWQRSYQAFKPSVRQQGPRLRKGGLYLITEGVEGLGMVMTQYLAKQYQGRFILTTKRTLPPPQLWQQRVEQGVQDSLNEILSNLIELQQQGIEFRIVDSDLSDSSVLASRLKEIGEQWGAINGFIHAPATGEEDHFRLLGQLSRAICLKAFELKVLGLHNLLSILPQSMDFAVLNGSLASVLAEKGQGLEAATNYYLDAQMSAFGEQTEVFAIDWDHWDLKRFRLDDDSTGNVLFNVRISAQGRYKLGVEEGCEVFERLLAMPRGGRVSISTGLLSARMEASKQAQAAAPMPVRDTHTGESELNAIHTRPDMDCIYEPPQGEIEQALADICAELLGIDKVGRFDNFFDLGGDSLLFLQVGSKVKQLYASDLLLGNFFETPTVADLALSLVNNGAKPVAEQSIPLEPQPTQQPQQTMLENQFEVAEGVNDDDKKAQMRKVYNTITQQLNSQDFAEHAVFLNFGYKENHLPQLSQIPLPERMLNRNCIKLVLELLADHDLNGKRVLDVGCGRGAVLSVVHRYFDAASHNGVDLSPEAIAFCQRNHPWPNTKFEVGDAENLPFDDGRFDVVTNCESSHSYPDLRAFYRGVYRVLDHGGHFLYTDLFPQDMLAECTDYLCSLGFEILADRDISENVLLSCDEIGAAHFNAFAQGNNAEALGNFLGVPGSKVYDDLEQGFSTYRIYKLKKA